jgi:hypothetical protein
MKVFAPLGDSIPATLTSTSQSFALANAPVTGLVIRLVQHYGPVVYIKFGDNTVVASAADSMTLVGPIPGGNIVSPDPIFVAVPSGATHIALIDPSNSSPLVNITEGTLIS